ncbi:hypothetical protein [Engelhardtia mirabilis]|uniref:Uncharacterized protein n=1 Tax=Engelhardtia mirabilis TaxID=2528011 RepID=A0A518BGP7_9BACT|nr:hypothetical protein Pla133_12110 [Planctomycetes bacterium Pla133]QDV00472.1 hypothetical protein Pla86_12110 [Planctomycetes bacterium Pla86]
MTYQPLPPLARPLALSVALAAQLTWAAPAQAQCFGPDGLSSSTCWSDVSANLPLLPPIDFQGSGFCTDSCDVVSSECIRIILSPPELAGCGEFFAQFSVLDCLDNPLLSGFPIRLDYTRTWNETSTSGSNYQVWRFAAKVDVSSVAGAPPTCLAAPCLGPYPTAFYYGYVDYALNCDTNTFESSIVLHHSCDRYIHDPLHSDKPGVFHPTTTYSIVGPVSTTNPFVPSASPRPGGPLFSEAVRVAAQGSPTCVSEERLTSGGLTPLIAVCTCPLAFGSLRNTISLYTGIGSCLGTDGLPSRFDSLDTAVLGYPWIHMLTTSIGSWTGTASYPGPERAFVEEGVFGYHDSCAVTGTSTGNFLEFHYGGSTAAGWAVTSLLSQNLIDTASNFSVALPAAIAPPFTGSALPSRHLIYANTP